MTVAAPSLDVFLSYVPADRDTAEVVERSLVDAGIVVRSANQVLPGAKFERQLRKLLVESDAVVVLVTPNSVRSSSMLIEIGAALGLDIPIHLLLSGIAAKDLPAHLRELPCSRVSNAAKVGEKLVEEATSWRLDESERAELTEIYRELGVPVDQLASNTASLDALADEFRRRTGRRMPNSRLLHGLLTLRKRGTLPRLKRKE